MHRDHAGSAGEDRAAVFAACGEGRDRTVERSAGFAHCLLDVEVE
jgi:hypothetical protein